MTAWISSSTFTRQISDHGSAIYLQTEASSKGALYLQHSLVTNNNIASVGGVIEASQWNVILLDSLITRNQGYIGIIVLNYGTSGSMTGCDVSLNYVGLSNGTGAVVWTDANSGADKKRQERQESASFNISKSSINLNTGYANGLYAAGVTVTITDSYIWSNVQHGIVCNGIRTVVDASQSNSIYHNAWGLPDAIRDIDCRECSIIVAGSQNGCCNTSLDLCGACGDQSQLSCLTTGCSIPYSNCSTTTLSRAEYVLLVFLISC
eukprot:TRINITY_DN5275_c0_g1_i1.p1 TRINITY_DN5275_c0_g1~~TRINITY_DN5275_c0_g1_i1.p1  ORF type:complete len:264 (-),score=10.04 TRINITY_DN5275_c0_g1_i1:148-939(-)